MNRRERTLLFLCLSFSSFLSFLGILFIYSSFQETFALRMTSLLPSRISLGFISLSASASIFYLLFKSQQPRYYRLEMENVNVSVHPECISTSLGPFFSKYFPGKEVPYLIDLDRGLIEISADLPHVSLDERGNFLTLLEEDIGRHLENIFNYKKPFRFLARFKN